MPTIEHNFTNVNYNSGGNNPAWIVIHNTANGTSAEGTAYNNTVYFKNEYLEASAHYFIDDGNTIWQCVHESDRAWHCGEAASRNGCYNTNSIGIEVCESADGKFTDKEKDNLAWLVQALMVEYDIDKDHICRHNDVTGKNCPWYYATNDEAWEELLEYITEGYNMNISDIWNYDWKDEDGNGTAPKGNMYNCNVWTYRSVKDCQFRIAAIEKQLTTIINTLNTISKKLK